MITFEVTDMTCGHCVGAITQALKAADRDAKVEIDLSSHRVRIEPSSTSDAVLQDAIRGAGYTPVPVDPSNETAVTKGVGRGGCCG